MDPIELLQNESFQQLLAMGSTLLWGALAFYVVLFFVSAYLFEVLAQKLDKPRWMAWIPIVNVYLMFALVGWERWFWGLLAGYVISFVCMFLGPLAILGVIAMIPTGIAALVMGLMFWPKLAMERGRSATLGLLIALPQFFASAVQLFSVELGLWLSLLGMLASAGAFLMIVFHDGGPEAPPHPVGYAVTMAFAGLLGLGIVLVEDELEDPEFQGALLAAFAEQQMEVSLEAEDGASLEQMMAQWTLEGTSAETQPPAQAPAPVVPGAPEPERIAERCPERAREQRGPYQGGRAFWCEVESGGQWVRHGPMKTWHPNGYIASVGHYQEGVRVGTWTKYWPQGGREVQAEFYDDVQNGWMYRWDTAGNLQNTAYYDDGAVVPAPTQPPASPQ